MIWRGTILMMIGQALAMLSGYGIQVFLARHLGPEQYGNFGVVQSILMIIELSVVAGVPNALKRFVGESPEKAWGLHRFLLKWQIGLSFFLFALAYVLAPFIARILNDESLVFILRWAIIDIVFFAIYWYYNGFLTGQRKFAKQTLSVAAYTVSKFILVVVLVSAGYGLVGAFVANFLASICGLAAGMFLFKIEKGPADISRMGFLKFIIPSIVYSIGVNLFFYIDLWFVKFYESGQAVGFYAVAGALARIPYFFSTALAGAIIPTLAFAVAKGADDDCATIIRQALRNVLLILCPMTLFVATETGTLIQFLFGAEYLQAAEILQILFAGMALLTLFSIMNAINIAKSGMLGCGIIVAGLVFVDAAANWLLVPEMGVIGGALATTLTMILGLVISSLFVFKQFEVFMEMRSIARILAVSLVLFAISWQIVAPDFWLMVLKVSLLLVAYVVLLRISGEITADEVRMIKGRLLPGMT